MNLVTKEELKLKIRKEYTEEFIIFAGIFLTYCLGLVLLLHGKELKSVEVFMVSFNLFAFSCPWILTLILYHKNKSKELVEFERKQGVALEYDKNPHKFVKNNLRIQNKEEIDKVVMRIQAQYLKKDKDNSYYDFENLYSSIQVGLSND